MARHSDFYSSQISDQRQLDEERRWAKDEREPLVSLRRIVTDEDRRETIALNFASAFCATTAQDAAVSRNEPDADDRDAAEAY